MIQITLKKIPDKELIEFIKYVKLLKVSQKKDILPLIEKAKSRQDKVDRH